MVKYINSKHWFNVKNDELTLKIDETIFKVAIEYTSKDNFVLKSDNDDEIWLNTTISGKAYRTYINDKIHVVSKQVLKSVISKEYKGTTLQTIEE